MIIAIVTLVILVLAFIFSMLGLGGAMLYFPVFHWFGYDFKFVAIPTGLLLNKKHNPPVLLVGPSCAKQAGWW